MKTIPLLIGAISLAAVLGVAIWEWNQLTSPGALHPSHASVQELQGKSGCAACHGEKQGSMTQACAACHGDIQRQIDTAAGLHGAMERGVVTNCSHCHSEHTGGSLALVSAQSFAQAGIDNPDSYKHNDIAGFGLVGKHVEIACDKCHTQIHADALTKGQKRFVGLSQECATCHEDVHKGAFGADCASCHGQVHAFKESPDFTHTTRFVLEGGHAGLTCEKCHRATGPDSVVALRAAPFTVRECIACHKDPHEGSLGRDCASCHGTSMPFDRAALFKHTDAFPLTGGHGMLACKDCHDKSGPRSVASLKVQPLASRDCAECHQSPHRETLITAAARAASLSEGASCIQCHKVEDHTFLAPASTMTPALHAAAGFPLETPHEKATCTDCHANLGKREALKAGSDLPAKFARLYPARTPEACAACHRDPHEGQFGAGETRGRCIACHDPAHFMPSAFTLTSHAQSRFPLTGAHKAVGCNLCHKKEGQGEHELVRFVPTSTVCADCHRDVHEGKFDGPKRPAVVNGERGCARCHTAEGFEQITWTAAEHGVWTGYQLKGLHETVACAECHTRRARPDGRGRTLGLAPKTCAECHTDPHAGQFAQGRATQCARCHTEMAPFKQSTFDHQRDSEFKLDEQHITLACAACHRPVPTETGTSIVRYKPLGTRCQDCHDPRALDRKGKP